MDHNVTGVKKTLHMELSEGEYTELEFIKFNSDMKFYKLKCAYQKKKKFTSSMTPQFRKSYSASARRTSYNQR